MNPKSTAGLKKIPRSFWIDLLLWTKYGSVIMNNVHSKGSEQSVSPQPKKFRVQESACKILAVLFWDKATFSIIATGINLAWTSPYLPILLNSTDIPTTPTEGAWCAVMPLLGAPPGAILAAFLNDTIGRKPTILGLAPVVLFCFILIAFAKSIWLFVLARFLLGTVEGGLFTVIPIYLSEISAPEIRGLMSSTISMALILGSLFINIIGPLTSIRISGLICSLVPLIHFVAFAFMPESPYYYIKKLRFDYARESLRVLRRTQDVSEELHELTLAVRRQENERSKLSDLFTNSYYRRSMLIFAILNATGKLSGKNPMLFYTTQIFTEIGEDFNPKLATVIYTLLELVTTLIAAWMIDRLGRRKLMLSSSAGCAIVLCFVAIYFVLKDRNSPYVPSLYWPSVTALFLYNIIVSLGLVFGPILLVSELFPTAIKSKALGVADTFSVAMGTIASQLFHYTGQFGLYIPFFIFSICCAIGCFLIYHFLVETKGKTLEEIQLDLIRNRK